MSALSAWMKDVEIMRLHQHNALDSMRSLIPKQIVKVVKSIETIIPSTENLTIDTEVFAEKVVATEVSEKKDEVVVEPLSKQAAKGKRKATTPTKPPAAKKTAVASKKVSPTPTTKPTVIDTPKVEVIVLDEAEVETVEAEPVLEVAKEEAAKVVEVIEIEDSPKPTKGKRKGATTTDTTQPKAPAKKAKATPKAAALPKRTTKKA